MVSLYLQEAIFAFSIAASFILAGNAINQSFMTVPALLVNFPSPSSPNHSAAAAHLGQQWPSFWKLGNNFFRPMTTLSTLGYAYTSWSMAQSGKGDWRLLAVAAILGLTTILHSAINMQPLNGKLTALAEITSNGKGTVGSNVQTQAEALARKWARWNLVRLVASVVSGSLATSQAVA